MKCQCQHIFTKQIANFLNTILQVTCGILIQPSISIVVEALGEDLYEVSLNIVYTIDPALYQYRCGGLGRGSL
jgi:hypothetical protein